MKNNSFATKKLVGLAVLTALVIILQFIGSAIRFGVFSISLVLIPIVVGAALYGVAGGAWLGFVFGVIVLASGDSGPFLAFNAPGTVITVLVKGTLAGLFAGLMYNLVLKLDKPDGETVNRLPDGIRKFVAVIVAAITCPIVNTGIFLLGCKLFFMDTIRAWAAGAGFENAGAYMILGLVGINFLLEVAVNVVASPIILRIINIGASMQRSQ